MADFVPGVSAPEFSIARPGELGSNGARPFLRWAGGKQWLADALLKAASPVAGRYIEPFVGGGAVFFRSGFTEVHLADANPALIETYLNVRDEAPSVISALESWRPDEETYYAIREQRFPSSVMRAAQFIYLNRTCWNGLYRVNRKGTFNVPYGRPSRRNPLETRSIQRASKSLQGVTLEAAHFSTTLRAVSAGDFVYCDPPYTLQHEANGFIKYNEALFRWTDQVELAAYARRLADSGALVVISNAWHPSLLELYDGFHALRLARRSTLGGSGARRGTVSEALFCSRRLALSGVDVIEGVSL